MSPKEFIGKFNYYYKNVNDESLNKGSLHRFMLFIDYVFAFIFHGCSITNYFVYGFYGMKHSERKKYVTWRRQNWIYEQCNDRKHADELYEEKENANTIFEKYLKRDWIIPGKSSFDKFEEFIARNPIFIAKPEDGTEGRGISKYDMESDKLDVKKLYDKLSKENMLLENYIIQHKVINDIHPTSVNTLRISTVNTEKGVQIMSASLRIGRHFDIKDNYSAGGVVSAVDLETGILKAPAVDKLHNAFVVHPETGNPIVGVEIPYWKEIKSMVIELGGLDERVRYTGWDIAVTESGPILVEANSRGNFHVQQHSDHEGKYLLYKEAIKILKNQGDNIGKENN